jgi:hypothetical protein
VGGAAVPGARAARAGQSTAQAAGGRPAGPPRRAQNLSHTFSPILWGLGCMCVHGTPSKFGAGWFGQFRERWGGVRRCRLLDTPHVSTTFPCFRAQTLPPPAWLGSAAPRNPRGRAVARTVRAPASGASALPPSHVLALCGWSARVGRVPVLCSGRCRVPKFSSRMRLLPPMRACRAAPGTVTAWTCPRATPSTGHIGRHGQLGEVPVARVSVSRMSPT